jgi:hypothetical protein
MTCREWLKSDRKGFMNAKTRLEAAVLAGKGKGTDKPSQETSSPEDDPYEGLSNDRVDELLAKEWEQVREALIYLGHLPPDTEPPVPVQSKLAGEAGGNGSASTR